jgi:hypothetical protein
MQPFLTRLVELTGHVFGVVEHLGQRLGGAASRLTPFEGAFVAVLGLTATVIGGRGIGLRLVGAAAGGLFASAYVARLTPWLEFLHVPTGNLLWAAPAVFGSFGALFPEGLAFFVVGLTVAAIASALVSPENHTLVVIPTFLLGGTVATLFFPTVALLASSFGGGLAFAAGMCAVLPRAGIGGWLVVHPLTLLIFGLVIGWVGFVGQMLGPTPEERHALADERAAQRKAKSGERAAAQAARRRKAS